MTKKQKTLKFAENMAAVVYIADQGWNRRQSSNATYKIIERFKVQRLYGPYAHQRRLS